MPAPDEARFKMPDLSKVTIEPLFEDMVDFETFNQVRFQSGKGQGLHCGT